MRRPRPLAAVVAFTLLAASAEALELRWPEGSLRGFPTITDLNGRTLAEGRHAQWEEQGLLHVKASYDFLDGRDIEETAAFRQGEALTQERWAWEERRGGELLRAFSVDFQSGEATAFKRDGEKVKRWTKRLPIDRPRAFAGTGFVLAVRNLAHRLAEGEEVVLQAIAFTPKPRVVDVGVRQEGQGPLKTAGRSLPAMHVSLRPKLPWVVDLFIQAPGTDMWLFAPPPPAFLRAQGPLMEPTDEVVRTDLLAAPMSEPRLRSARRKAAKR
jgi:hypothetical protein